MIIASSDRSSTSNIDKFRVIKIVIDIEKKARDQAIPV